MKIKTSELTRLALNWAVAKCEESRNHYQDSRVVDEELYAMFCDVWLPSPYSPSTNWSRGGQIIDREKMTTAFCTGDLGESRTYWIATIEPQSWEYGYGPDHAQDEDRSLRICKPDVTKGPTPLIAAMRCYVASKLGDEVDVPEELISTSPSDFP